MSYLLRRLATMFLVVIVATAMCFGALNLFGDPLTTLLGPLGASGQAPQEAVDRVNEQYHLDDPLPVRYVRWAGDVVRGDFGDSYSETRPVLDILKERVPRSLMLMVMAQVLAMLIAIPWAIVSAARANGAVDRASTTLSFALIAIPNFALGVLLYYFFCLRLEWFPSKYKNENLLQSFQSMFIPALTLALGLAATYQRLLRTDLITTLQEDFILMARAKGVPKWRVLFGHALRPSLFSFITVFGLNIGGLIGGALVVEQIFQIPGAGRSIATAVFRDDFPLVLGLVVIIAVIYVMVNFVVDLLYTIIDPRVRGRET